MKSGGYEYKGSVKHPSPDQGEGCLQDLNKKHPNAYQKMLLWCG